MFKKYIRTITFVLIFSIIFTSISFDNVAYADTKPQITRVELEAVNQGGTEITRYKIRGLNFETPEFLIDTYPITTGMYTVDNGAYIIEKDASNSDWDIWLIPLEGKTIEIKAVNSDSDGDNTNNSHAIDFKIEKLPHINSVSSQKVYVGESLTIYGTGFDITEIDGIYVAGVPYTVGYKQGSGTNPNETLQDIIDDLNNGIDPDPNDKDSGGNDITYDKYDYIVTTNGDIHIPDVKEPHQTGGNDVQVIKDTGDKIDTDERSVEGSVVGRYREAVRVVKEVETIDIQKIVPNTGPVEGGTEVKIYENVTLESSLQPDMKLYVEQTMGQDIYTGEFTDIKLITNGQGDVIGISGVTPPSPTGDQGVFDIIITDNTGVNEQRINNAFAYEEKQNLLQLSDIEPIEAKPFETVEISGANLINLNISYLENWSIKKDGSGNDDAKYENDKYIISYQGQYLVEDAGGSTVLKDIDITREIQLIIGQVSEIVDQDTLVHSPSLDKLQAIIPETNDYGVVTVTVNTSTTVKDGSNIIDIIEEEAELTDGFTIIPSNTTPVINSIEPATGHINEKIYITIKGENFQVLSDADQNPDYPEIIVGHKTLTDSDIIGVYDDENNPVNGVGREIGTVIKAVIPQDGDTTVKPGPVNVKITNPDGGYVIEYKIFEFEKPARDPNLYPNITKIDPNIGPLEGGNIITIEGENFDYQEPVPDVIVTIDGEIAKVISASSTMIQVEVPPGTEIGEKPVQVITEDGAMDTIDPKDTDEERDGYTYVRVISDPDIENIAPNFGGEGTVVYILGRDQGPDNPNFFKPIEDPTVRIEEMIGTRVLLNGIDVNEIEEEYDVDGNLTGGNVYLKTNNKITPDGTGNVYKVDGDGNSLSKVTVIDDNTIRLVIPKGYTAGLKDVTILNPDSSSDTIENGFDYKIPPQNADVQITSIDPNLGSNIGGDYITIEGNDFKDGAKVLFGGYPSDNVKVISGNKLLVKTPAYPLPNPDLESQKDVEIVIVNYDGSSVTSSPPYPDGGYRYMAPITQPNITSIDPNSGTTLGNEIVTIYGTDFRKVTVDKDGIELPEPEYPKVFFGGKEAEIIEYQHNKLVVRTPFYGKEELVDVTVKNPQQEFGSVTKNNYFQYRTSNPIITSVFPEKAQKIGGDEITVKGKEILPGDFSGEIQRVPSTTSSAIIDVLAIFGDEKDEDSVLFGSAENTLSDITINYKADRKGFPITLDDGSKTEDSLVIYHEGKGIAHYDLKPEERRIFIIDWQALGIDMSEEAITVELIDDTLISRRRVAPTAEIINKGDDDPIKAVNIQVPPAVFIGQINLYIENQDRGWDKATFEYVSPSSRPVIRNITPSTKIFEDDNLIKYYIESTIEGGLYITIDGYDLRQNVEVFIDGTLAPLVSRNVLNEEDSEGRLRSRIVVKSPKGDTDDLNKELKIMIVNQDGGFVDASDISKINPGLDDQGDPIPPKPYYFIYRIPESSPYIDSILPAATSQAGGNNVRIIGYDFRTGVTVLIGGKSCSVVSVDNDEIVIETPTDLTPGLKDVQVINSDHGAVTKMSALSVISYPIITTVTTEGGDTVDRVSIEGGAKIVLSGKNFQNGAKIYFGGERKSIGVSQSADTKGLFANDNYYEIEDAFLAQGVEFVNENQLIVTVPEVFKEGDYTITVLNVDGGLSDNNRNLEYRVPIPTDPIGLEAEIVNEKYIRIYGYESTNAVYYEVYVYLGDDYPDDKDFMYLDTTEKTSYKITKFKEIGKDEDIYLRIRAVNKYGPSEWSNIERISYSQLDDIDGIGDEDEDGDLVSDYQESVGNDGVNIVLGNKGLRGSNYDYYVIDLKDSKYQKIDKRIINIPGKVIKESSRIILVDNGETRMQFSPRSFYIYSFYSMSSSDQEKTYGRVTFNKAKGRDSDYIERKIPRKYKLVSKIYEIKTELHTDRNTVNIDTISGSMDLEITYDENRLMGLKESKLQLHKYDPKEGKWVPLAGGVDKDNNKVYARIYGPGQYAILGEK